VAAIALVEFERYWVIFSTGFRMLPSKRGVYWPAWVVNKQEVKDLDDILFHGEHIVRNNSGVIFLARKVMHSVEEIVSILITLGYWVAPRLPMDRHKEIGFQGIWASDIPEMIMGIRNIGKMYQTEEARSLLGQRMAYLRNLKPTRWWAGADCETHECIYLVSEFTTWVFAESFQSQDTLFACRNDGKGWWREVLALPKPLAVKSGMKVIRHRPDVGLNLYKILMG
jgi:hypothetical protein